MLDSYTGESSKFFQDRFKSAAWLIKSVDQRQKTIFKVAESIFKYQDDFLEYGVGSLKPLVLRDIAADIGLHESTISRVTNNKYVHTSQGVYELKFFFSSCLKSTDGDVSSECVKDKIKQLVDMENPKRPLSDQAIAKKLKTEGIEVARRTVAKYREALRIPSSTKRKQRI
jgi:RNA polymerase sigma-54 factor